MKTPGEEAIATPLFVATCPHCGLEFDWRASLCSLRNDHSRTGLSQFAGATFQWEEYIAPSLAWDHEHCLGCWQKFMELDHPEVERFGYVTHNNGQEWWACATCFDDFAEEMGWRVEPSGPAAAEPT